MGGASGGWVGKGKEIKKCKLPVEKQSLGYKVNYRKDSHNYVLYQMGTRFNR